MSETLYYSNDRYAAENSCKVCEKLGGHHEVWCEARKDVLYAWAIVEDPKLVTPYDRVALHGMGATYCKGACDGKTI